MSMEERLFTGQHIRYPRKCGYTCYYSTRATHAWVIFMTMLQTILIGYLPLDTVSIWKPWKNCHQTSTLLVFNIIMVVIQTCRTVPIHHAVACNFANQLTKRRADGIEGISVLCILTVYLCIGKSEMCQVVTLQGGRLESKGHQRKVSS